ncbi:MAG: lysylphosphatidylglycerol synthase domain-containing protein, partial [Candidatus Nanohaloarchaea archaeon]|nr:lysylphosphatidylglycerol synthase domain-containing protein [Candidatus Nanohaloarchaea archaeon]
MNRRIRQLSQAAVILLSGAIIARLLSDDLPQVLQYLARVEYAWLLAAAALLWAGMLVGRYTWRMVMRAVGHDLPFLDAMRLISMFQVASYIPGGFWHFLGIAYWAEDEDVPKTVTAVGTVINAGSAVIVALLLFFAVAPFYLPASSVLTYLPLLVAVPAGLVAVHPRVFYPVMNRGLELLGRDPIDPVLSYAELLEVFAVNLLSRAFTGAALYALAASVTQVNPALFPALTAFYAGA